MPSFRGSICTPDDRRTLRLRLLLASSLVLATVVFQGCSRGWYRQQADAEAFTAIAEKEAEARVHHNERPVAPGPGPGSRLFDPYSVDHPPMPPDDPLAHRFMHWVDDKLGYPHWHENGDVPSIENTTWTSCLPWNEEGVVALDRRSAVKVALLNSRDYQREIEDLYLSALGVTFERFRFDSQYFLGTSTEYDVAGRRHPVGGPRSFSELTQRTDGQVRRLTSTGGELIAGFANSLIWEFSGTNTSFAGTILNFSLVQPLLRFGGRARILERLTQAERNLLANVRQMEQFRHGFVLEVLTGRNSGEGPSAGGAVGASGLGLLAGSPAGRTGAPSAQGYFGLLQDQQEIRNQEANVASLRDSLAQLVAAFEAGRIRNRLQVDQARQALYNAQSSLSVARAGYQTKVDLYKVELGLPPELKLVIEDTYLDRFNLISPELTRLQNKVADLLDAIRTADRRQDEATLNATLGELALLRSPIFEQLDIAVADLENFRRNLPDRERQLRRLAERHRDTSQGIDSSIFDESELPAVADALERRLRELRRGLSVAFEQLDLVRDGHPPTDPDFAPTPGVDPAPGVAEPELPEAQADGAAPPQLEEGTEPLSRFYVPGPEKKIATRISELLLGVLLSQAKARLESIVLVPIEAETDVALQVARNNRLDWMNARARLVDSWRQIEFTANALKSELNITADGDLRTVGDNPLKFDSDAGRLRLGVAFDTPLTRVAERNDYREAQIAYQRARRDYMLFADRIHLSLRNTLRIAELSELNFELRRAAVQVAIAQVDLARLRLNEPPRDARTNTVSPTTARDLVSALGDLLDAQNDFLDVWVSYEVLRMVFDFELGTIQLDDEGMWIDPGPVELDGSHLPSGPFAPAAADASNATGDLEHYEVLPDPGPAPQPLPPPQGPGLPAP